MDLPSSGFSELDSAFKLSTVSPEHALEICENFLQKNPPNSFCYQIQYNAYRRLENWSKALEKANQLISCDPMSDMSYFDRACAHYKLGNHIEAANDAQTAIDLDYEATLGTVGHRLKSLSQAAIGDILGALATAHSIPELKQGDWYPPVGPIPAGTKAQFTAMVERMAHQVRDQQNS